MMLLVVSFVGCAGGRPDWTGEVIRSPLMERAAYRVGNVLSENSTHNAVEWKPRSPRQRAVRRAYARDRIQHVLANTSPGFTEIIPLTHYASGEVRPRFLAVPTSPVYPDMTPNLESPTKIVEAESVLELGKASAVSKIRSQKTEIVGDLPGPEKTPDTTQKSDSDSELQEEVFNTEGPDGGLLQPDAASVEELPAGVEKEDQWRPREAV